MITTVLIPYLLQAFVSNPMLEHGPEFKFSLDIAVDSTGQSTEDLYPGLNLSNELRCRVKDVNVLSCKFRHVEFDFYDRNLTSGELIRDTAMNHHQHQDHHQHERHHQHRRHIGHPPAFVFNWIPFELNFNEKGVSSIVLSESATKDIRLDLVRSVANLLNANTDVSKTSQQQSSATKSEELINFLTGKCMGEIEVSYKPYEGNAPLKNYNLDLAEPLPKLSSKSLNINKRMQMTNCPSSPIFFWSGLVVKNIHADPKLKLLALNEEIIATKDKFVSKSLLKLETAKNGHPMTISDSMKLQLSEINPAEEAITEIKDPKVIPANSE